MSDRRAVEKDVIGRMSHRRQISTGDWLCVYLILCIPIVFAAAFASPAMGGSLIATLCELAPAMWTQPAGAPSGGQAESADVQPQPASAEAAASDDRYKWRSLFDGKDLGKWTITRFGGEGEVTVKDGCIVLGMGNPMTGITWTGEVPRENYELELEAKRTSGIDFFATTTFPVGKEYCSFVVGGWAGTVVGLSSINLRDASENETTQFKVFQDNRWYRIRIRVSESKVECWIDDEKLVDIKREGRKFSVRMECDLCRPLGIATWCTESLIRNIRIRELTPQEVVDIAEGLR